MQRQAPSTNHLESETSGCLTLFHHYFYSTIIYYVYIVCVCEGNFRMIGDDLVNSYHLLLCCLDLVFGNALLCANRKDLINPTFRGRGTEGEVERERGGERDRGRRKNQTSTVFVHMQYFSSCKTKTVKIYQTCCTETWHCGGSLVSFWSCPRCLTFPRSNLLLFL